jgi:hypothetical protein
MRNTNLSIQDIREAIGKKEKAERIENNENAILGQYLQDQKLVNSYFIDKENFIANLKNDQEGVQKLIEKKIEEKFEKVNFLIL